MSYFIHTSKNCCLYQQTQKVDHSKKFAALDFALVTILVLAGLFFITAASCGFKVLPLGMLSSFITGSLLLANGIALSVLDAIVCMKKKPSSSKRNSSRRTHLSGVPTASEGVKSEESSDKARDKNTQAVVENTVEKNQPNKTITSEKTQESTPQVAPKNVPTKDQLTQHEPEEFSFVPGKMIYSRREVEMTLGNAPPYDFRVWKSETQKGALSFAVKLPWGLIDLKRLNRGDWKPELIPLMIRATALLLNFAQHKTLFFKKDKDIQTKKSYDRQLILDLGSGNSAKGLTWRAQQKGHSCETLDLKKCTVNESNELNLTERQIFFFNQLTHHSRLYIIGHGSKGSSIISSDQKLNISVQNFAQTMIKYAPQLKQPSENGSKIRISVVACFAGMERGTKKSFCEQLFQELTCNGMHCEILGRTNVVSRWGENPAGYKKFVNGRYHHTGDKRIWEEGKAMREIFYDNDLGKIRFAQKGIDSIQSSSIETHPLSLGVLSEAQANTILETYVKFNALEEELKIKPIWLLRKDPAQQKKVISYYVDGKCQHYFIEQLEDFSDIQNVEQNIVFQQVIAFEEENFQDRLYR